MITVGSPMPIPTPKAMPSDRERPPEDPDAAAAGVGAGVLEEFGRGLWLEFVISDEVGVLWWES